ncbi:hypothetical protein [Shewanella sp. JNE4-2]|uniref:hypothetical protein n=1 Tax=Shewanella sp. JNE4-2 TaxID=2983532 RepID=UPI002002B460|nr:hypothetical protein [Shewanella sp. JNE4-2]MCK7657733.1 hypothetical protein [Shewanella sp. JNE4-2]
MNIKIARVVIIGFKSGEISAHNVRSIDFKVGDTIEEGQIKRAASGILEECESLLIVAGENLTGQFSEAEKASTWALKQLK